jgi:hypothetical protein
MARKKILLVRVLYMNEKNGNVWRLREIVWQSPVFQAPSALPGEFPPRRTIIDIKY